MYEKLNIKKVIIAISIGVLLIVSIIVFVISRVGAKENEVVEDVSEVKANQENTKMTFTDTENTISLELDKKYNFAQVQNNKYLIKLTSEENAEIFISKLEGLEDKDLYSVARADKLAYLESYNSYSNLSDLKELSVNGNQAFTYSFHYLDENLKKAFYIQVVLLKVNNTIYVFDEDFPLDQLDFYTNLLVEVLTDFKVIRI